ncbi:hypothetical protein Q5752_000047 [Cryptotrichosporon argae]
MVCNDDGDDGFTRVPTREEKRKQRKVEKRRPQFQFDTNHFANGRKIGVAHVRDLVLYTVADGQRPTWMVVENPSAIPHTVVLLVPGLLPEHLGLPPIPVAAALPFSTTPSSSSIFASDKPLPSARIPTIPRLFMYGVPTRAPGDNRKLHSVVGTLLQSPLTEMLKKRRENALKAMIEAKPTALSTPLLYILTPNEMQDNGYRLPSFAHPSDRPYVPGGIPSSLAAQLEATHRGDFDAGDVTTRTVAAPRGVVVVDEQGRRRRGNVRAEEGWVETKKAGGPAPDGRYPVLGIDCEMCLSEDGQELARVSVVNLDSDKVVFDELVAPPKPVIDYLTQYSGLTAKRLSTATHTLETVQAALATGPDPLITPHTILLGHSLDCDLAVLKIRHPLVIDTSVIYRHPRGPPYKPGLKWLAQKWLNKEIQAGSEGHDSEEDARTCLELLRKKLAHGPDFGDPSIDVESIFERVGRYKSTPHGPAKTTALVDYGNPSGWYGAKATATVACSTDDEVVEGVLAEAESKDLVVGRFMELGNVQGWHNYDPLAPAPEASQADVDAALDRLDARLDRIHSALPKNAALVVLTGHGDPRRMLELVARRGRWERSLREHGIRDDAGAAAGPTDERRERWSTEDERELEAAVALAREGMAFFCVKS